MKVLHAIFEMFFKNLIALVTERMNNTANKSS